MQGGHELEHGRASQPFVMATLHTADQFIFPALRTPGTELLTGSLRRCDSLRHLGCLLGMLGFTSFLEAHRRGFLGLAITFLFLVTHGVLLKMKTEAATDATASAAAVNIIVLSRQTGASVRRPLVGHPSPHTAPNRDVTAQPPYSP